MYVSGIFMAIVSKSASKCFGIKVACVISCMFGIAGCLWMYQGNTNCNIVLLSKWWIINFLNKLWSFIIINLQLIGTKKDETFKKIEIYVVAAFIGSGGAGMLITSLSITAELIGKNKESSAFVYGAISLVDKISNGSYSIL